jgi:hypothetical protein
MSHIRCCYCGIFFPLYTKEGETRHDQLPHGCATPITNSEIGNQIQCYSCGTNEINKFTKSQIKKQGEARCKKCVLENMNARYVKYSNNQKYSIDKQLYDAVAEYNVEEVRRLLNEGANPNYTRQNNVYDLISNKYVYTYLFDGTEEPEYDLENMQPTTPLKLVVFRISDCMLECKDIQDFAIIAKLLIDAGADKKLAGEYAKNRYCLEDNDYILDDIDIGKTQKAFSSVIRTIMEK